MASTYTSNLNIEKPAQGDQVNAWGPTVNDNMDLIDTAVTANLPKAGGTMTGDTLHGNNVKAKFGAANNLEIYADNINSFIKESGSSGNLRIQGQTIRLEKADGEIMLNAFNDGAVELNYDTVKKFETSATGATLTGNLVITGTVDGVDIATRDGVLTSTTTTANAALPKAGGTMTGNLTMGANEIFLSDNGGIRLGDSEDLQIVHDGTDSVIKDGGTGALEIRATDFRLNNSANSKNMIKAFDGGDVSLYYDNNLRLQTSNAGVGITGGITVTGTVDGRDVATDGTKLDGIASGAEVNVQSDWNAGSGDAQILNKPTIPSNNNQLTNGAGYITSVSGNITQLSNNAGYVTSSGVTSVATGNGCTGRTFTSSGTVSMSGSYSGSFSASSNITAYSSDERLKDFKGKIDNALDKVDQLNGYYFEWNDVAKGLDGGKSFKEGMEVGVSAQEIEKVLPEVVTEAPIVKIENLDTDYKTVYYDKIVPLLIEAIKELNEKLDKKLCKCKD
tara:strand:- start:603 stop:2117 length:1515 start_codon:yes stop_codon:yes gene_type:complete